MEIENANQIHAALMSRGLSCRSWALTKGYNPVQYKSAYKCLRLIQGLSPNGAKYRKPYYVTYQLKLILT